MSGPNETYSPSDTTDAGPALSLLDEVSVWNGASAAQVYQTSLDMAVYAEQLGYRRYWFSENHNTTRQAGSAPELLIARLAAATDRIHVGTSNLMLPLQSALKVAENFRTLEGLHPGRIDLGLALFAGQDALLARAMHRTHEPIEAEQFPDQLEELLAYLTDRYATSRGAITAAPVIASAPRLWLQGAYHDGARHATDCGLGLVMRYADSPALAANALQAYRRFFKPSVFAGQPRSVLIVSALCADTDEAAGRLAGTRAEAHAEAQPDGRPLAQGRPAGGLLGSASQVGAELRRIAAETAADELMILTPHPDIQVRRRSARLLADEFRLGGQPITLPKE